MLGGILSVIILSLPDEGVSRIEQHQQVVRDFENLNKMNIF